MRGLAEKSLPLHPRYRQTGPEILDRALVTHSEPVATTGKQMPLYRNASSATDRL